MQRLADHACHVGQDSVSQTAIGEALSGSENSEVTDHVVISYLIGLRCPWHLHTSA
jgi:hypothetical protein